MSAWLPRRGEVLLLALGLAACQQSLAQQAAAIDEVGPVARTSAVDPPAVQTTAGGRAPTVARAALDHAAAVLIGQHVNDLQASGPWVAYGSPDGDEGGCEYYEGGGLPPGVLVMVENGRVVRFDLGPFDETQEPTDLSGPFGLRIGMTRARALAQFPGAPVSSPHAYGGERDEYLTWRDPGSGLGIRVELFEGKVQQMYWGTREAIELIEGCS